MFHQCPCNYRVTDVNDNSPVFIGSPYVLNISEVSLRGSVIFSDVLAVDVDQPGPFSTVQYNIEPGPFSDTLVFDNQLQGRLSLAKQLDYEKQKQIKLKIVAQDQGLPPRYNETSLTINVLDADDQNPSFYYNQYTAVLPEDTAEGMKLVVEPEDVAAYDKDKGINAPVYYTFAGTGLEYRHFELNRNTGAIYMKGQPSEAEFTQSSTLVIRATQFDNPDRYSVTTLTVSRGGRYSTKLTFLESRYTAEILENTPLNSVVLTMGITGTSHRPFQFDINYRQLPGREFSVNSRGEVILRKTVDYETVESYSFSVTASDGWYNDTANVRIALININDWDPRFKHPEYAFYVGKENIRRGYKVGEVQVFDGDKGDHVSLDIRGAFARVFGISNKGEIMIRDMNYMNGTEAHIVVVAEDSGIPPRRASVPVVVKFDLDSTLSSGLRGGGGHNWVMIVILSVVIIFSLMVIIGLGVYICKHKKHNKTKPSSFSDNVQYNLHQIDRSGSQRRRLDINHNDSVKNINPLAASGPQVNYPTFSSSVRPRSSSSSTNSSEINFTPQTMSSPAPASSTVYNPLNPRSGSRRYVKNSKHPRTHPPVVHQVPAPSHPPVPPPQSQPQVLHQIHPPQNQVQNNSSNSTFNSSTLPNINHSGLPKVPQPQTRPKPKLKPKPNLSKSASTSDLSNAHMNLQAELKRAILGSSQQSLASSSGRLEWPRSSMPRVVKKLSWPDDQDRDMSFYNYTDPNMSVTPQLTLVPSDQFPYEHEHF